MPLDQDLIHQRHVDGEGVRCNHNYGIVSNDPHTRQVVMLEASESRHLGQGPMQAERRSQHSSSGFHRRCAVCWFVVASPLVAY